MAPKVTSGELSDYIERWGMLFEVLGGTRMMGRILGWLLVCEPPEQSAADIAVSVNASAGTVSTSTRTLVQASMIERVGVPGKRSAHFRVKPGMWANLLQRRMSSVKIMGELADEGLKLSPAPDGGPNIRLHEIDSYCRFIDKELLALLDRWVIEWEKEQKK